MYDARVRRLVIACVLLAGIRLALAQPGAPGPVASPASPAPAHAPATATSAPSPSAEEATIDRERAEALCAARDPSCDWLATLGGLERASVVRALAARGYELEPSPWGKVIGRIHVHNEDVFAEGARLLRFLNRFHVTTKEYAIRREVVVRPGEVWDPERVAETARRLRDPMFSSVIVVLPVTSAQAGTVDVLVVTRDIWSLRLNTNYTYQDGKLTDLAISLSENNFLGRRKTIAAALTMDQGKIEAGPLYIDKNFLGRFLELRGRVNTIVNRDALFERGELDTEGSSSTISLRKMLWQLASTWGYGVSFTHRYAIERRFEGTQLRPMWCPDGVERCEFVTREEAAMLPSDELLPSIYRTRRWAATASAVRQWGTRVKHQLSFGYTVDSVKPRLLDDFAGTPAQQAAFRRAVLPPTEVMSTPFVSYGLFTPRYRTRRNVQTYDLAEDLRLGPDLEISYSLGLELLGSTYDFHRAAASAGWTVGWGRDGSARLAAGVATRYQDGELRDNTASVATRIVTPTLLRLGRIVAESTLATRWNERTPGIYTLGSDNGLRGFRINQFFGRRLFSTQIEARSRPARVWVVRVGGVMFYELGGAANTLRELDLHHDAGVGFRMLLPQTSRELFRFDFAVPLDGPTRGQLKFQAGFQSEF